MAQGRKGTELLNLAHFIKDFLCILYNFGSFLLFWAILDHFSEFYKDFLCILPNWLQNGCPAQPRPQILCPAALGFFFHFSVVFSLFRIFASDLVLVPQVLGIVASDLVLVPEVLGILASDLVLVPPWPSGQKVKKIK